MKFKTGDIITGNSGDGIYSMTNEDATMEVLKIVGKDGLISVKIVEHKKRDSLIGRIYTLDSQYFRKVGKSAIKIKTMNNNQSVYWECTINEHNKFWAAHIIKRGPKFVLTRKWGRVGNNPQTMEQEFDCEHEAKDVLQKLTQDKERKGYKPIF